MFDDMFNESVLGVQSLIINESSKDFFMRICDAALQSAV